MKAITVTQGAQEYLNNLLEDNTNIKLTIDNVGTPRAETVLQYCKEGEEEDLTSLDLQGFNLIYNEKGGAFHLRFFQFFFIVCSRNV